MGTNLDSPKTVRGYLFQEGVRGRIFRRAFVGKLIKLYEIMYIEPTKRGEVNARIKYHYNDDPKEKDIIFDDIGLSSLLFDNGASQEELNKVFEITGEALSK